MFTLVYAPSIVSGGGLTLLIDLIEEVKLNKSNIKFIVHERLKGKVPDDLVFEYAKSGLRNRFQSELTLKRNSKFFHKLLMFCNLPPLFKLSCEVVTFVHNRLILQMHHSHFKYPKAYFRIKILAFLFSLFSKHSNYWIVQTSVMKDLLQQKGKSDSSIRVFRTIPNSLYTNLKNTPKISDSRHLYKYLSVTNPEPHKHNDKLIEAWVLMAKEGLFPKLHIVTTKIDDPLSKSIDIAITNYSADIEIFENINKNKIESFYRNSDCLIFTSGCESLGLPLIEAIAFNLPILASDKDFVYEVSSPMAVFNPEDPSSIKDCVTSAYKGKFKVVANKDGDEEILPISEMLS